MKGVLNTLKQSVGPIVKDAVNNSLVSGGAALGSYASSRTGIPGLSILGGTLGAKLSKLIGSGDYASNDVATNSLFRGKLTQMPTEFGNDPHHIRVRHREYLGDIVAGATDVFTLTKFSVNPGLCATFPYLWQLASLYEEYTFAGLVYEYVSLTSPYNATSAMGAVIFAAEYNTYANPYASKLQMENSDFALSVRPDHNMVYGIECKPGDNTQNSYFVRQGDSNAPRTATDLCDFYVGVQTSLPPGGKIGELWACYDVILKRPILGRSIIATAHLTTTELQASKFTANVAGPTLATTYNTVISVTGAYTASASVYAASGQRLLLTVDNICPGDVYSVQCIWHSNSDDGNIVYAPIFTPLLSDDSADYVSCSAYTNTFLPPYAVPPLVPGIEGSCATGLPDSQNKNTTILMSGFVQADTTLGLSSIGIPIIVGDTGVDPPTGDLLWNIDVIITRVIAGVSYKHY
jgi:hypothetical protein